MTALQVIIKEAKAIRKKSPKMEWKKAVAQASAIYASKHKGKSPVGKKHAVKKKAAKKVAKKKAVGKYVKTVRKGKVTDVIYKRKKIGAVKKSATTMHKDTKSHNVNIRVMSGVGALSSHVIHEVKEAHDKLIKWKKVLLALEKEKTMVTKGMKPVVNMDIKRAKEAIKEQKTHIAQLKKHIK
jgi:hypothetical protein